MRYNELLFEYIKKGNLEYYGKTFVVLFEKKYLIFFNNIEKYPENLLISFSLDKEGKEKIINLLRNNIQERELNSDNVTKAIFGYMKDIVNQHTYHSSNLNINENLKEFFHNILCSRDEKNLALMADMSIRYKPPRINIFDELDKIYDKDIPFTISLPTNYIVIDHDEKTIKRIDRSKSVKPRMQRLNRTSTSYLIPEHEWSIEKRDFAYIIEELKNHYNIDDYEIESVSEDYRRGIDRYKQDVGAIKQLTQNKEIVCYHGTSNSIWRKIKSDGYLKPDMGEEYGDVRMKRSNVLYFTLDPDIARKYAVRASGSNNYVILEIRIILDPKKVVFDEDNIMRALKFVFLESNRKRDRYIRKILVGDPEPIKFNSQKERDTVDFFHTHMVLGKYDRIFNDTQMAIAEYIKYVALKLMKEDAFAYVGRIPLENISIYEKGKSKKYKEPKSTLDYGTEPEDYEEVEGKIKRY